jgi:hypothetical protein
MADYILWSLSACLVIYVYYSIAREISPAFIRIPPGVCIAMMGLLAALYPILTHDSISPREKAIWVSGFFLLMVLEIRILYKERARQDHALLGQIRKLDEIRNAYDAHAIAIERLRSSVKSESLRDRALRLSESILEFVHTRLVGEPEGGTLPIAFAGMRAQKFANAYASIFPSAEVLSYRETTLAIYVDRFSWNVLGVLGDFEARKIVDDKLRDAAGAPNDAGTILYIGQRLGELAEDISD